MENHKHKFEPGPGGHDKNPGVWSMGGTTLRYLSTCEECGAQRHEIAYGSQRNPGDRDYYYLVEEPNARHQPEPVRIHTDCEMPLDECACDDDDDWAMEENDADAS